MAKWRKEFAHTRALILRDVAFGKASIERGTATKHVAVPMLIVQLHPDFFIHAERDGQAAFDDLGAQDKEPQRIEDSNERFCAYNHFGRHPEHLVGGFDQHLSEAAQRLKA